MVVNKVELCGVNTSKLPLLREKEKEELFRRIRQGDKLAREEYIKGNLRLVLSVAGNIAVEFIINFNRFHLNPVQCLS